MPICSEMPLEFDDPFLIITTTGKTFMNHKMTRRQALLGLAMTGSGIALPARLRAQPAGQELVAAAENEGQLVVYGDPFTVPLLVKAFAARYPRIRVTSATGDGWQMYNRFVSETRSSRPLMDVMYQAEDTVITARDAGSLADFDMARSSEFLPLAIPESGGYVRGNANLILFAWNKTAMANIPTPKDWTDFATPPAAWTGLIATTNPASSSSTFATIASLYQKFGVEKGGEILRGLRQARAELNPAMGVMTTKLQTGERPLSFFNITTAVSGILRQGAPVTLTVPESGGVAQFNALGISRTAPHPNAARLFAEFALGAEMQSAFVAAGVHGLRADSATPEGMPALAGMKLIELDLPQALKDRDAILAWWSSNTGFSFR
jgi:iron(III) transport system substrate-binding protein